MLNREALKQQNGKISEVELIVESLFTHIEGRSSEQLTSAVLAYLLEHDETASLPKAVFTTLAKVTASEVQRIVKTNSRFQPTDK